MVKKIIKGISFLILCFCVSGCLISCKTSGNSNTSSIDVFGLSDETEAAGEIVKDANEDLKKIRKMYKENQSKIEDLKNAMKEAGQNPAKIDEAKKIADDLVKIINDGFALGESAIEKLDKAEAMNTNDKFKEYLQLKKSSLQKQLDAFEFRRKAAITLRDAFGTKDKFAIERAKSDFKDNEENFQKYMEIAREMSGEANQLAKEAMQQSN